MPDSARRGRTQQRDRFRHVVPRAWDIRGRPFALAKPVSAVRSSSVSAASVRSSMSGPESSRLMTTDASRRTARSAAARPQRLHQRHQRRVQHQAVGQVDDLGRPLLMQAEDDAPAGSADGEVDAAALAGQAGDERQRIRRREARPGAARGPAGRISRPGSRRRASAAARSRHSGRNGGMAARRGPRWDCRRCRRWRASRRRGTGSDGRVTVSPGSVNGI